MSADLNLQKETAKAVSFFVSKFHFRPYTVIAGNGQSMREGRRFHGYRGGTFPQVPAGPATQNFWSEVRIRLYILFPEHIVSQSRGPHPAGLTP